MYLRVQLKCHCYCGCYPLFFFLYSILFQFLTEICTIFSSVDTSAIELKLQRNVFICVPTFSRNLTYDQKITAFRHFSPTSRLWKTSSRLAANAVFKGKSISIKHRQPHAGRRLPRCSVLDKRTVASTTQTQLLRLKNCRTYVIFLRCPGTVLFERLVYALTSADFRPIFSRSASAVTPSKKVQLTLIESPLPAFQWA